MGKFKILWSSILTILLFITIDTGLASAESFQGWEGKKNIDPNHEWTITFNGELDRSTINSENIYIQYNDKIVEDIQLSLGTDKKSIKVKAPKNGYQEYGPYILNIEKGVKSAKGEELKQPVKMKFTVEQSNLASKLLIKVRGTETPEELWDLLDQSPYLYNFSDELLVRHKVGDELSNEIYDLFGVETEFSYYFYTGLLGYIAYDFDANEQMFNVLKEELISLLGVPKEDNYWNNGDYSVEWWVFGKGDEYGYDRVVLSLRYGFGLSLTQVTL